MGPSGSRRGAGAALTVLALALLPGCLGSEKTYRPYIGEKRPDPEEKVDPIQAEVALRYNVPREVDDNTTFIGQSRKSVNAILDTVRRNPDSSPRNSYNTWEDDMVAVLGPQSIKRRAPRPQPKPDRPTKKAKEAEEEGEGGDKPAEKGDKDKPAEGDKGEKKD
ncbi:hypothetical protein HY251_16290 [bacterium]|nr:hypothetical protein [bacterium]